MRRMNKLVLWSLMTVVLWSCSSGTQSNTTGTNPTPSAVLFEIHLTDAPADYEALILEVRDVQINKTTDENTGWQTMQNVKVGLYDLLKLTNGLDTLLATDNFKVGDNIKQIRLILGENNLIGENGRLYPLTVPSGQTSGIKLLVNTTLEANKSYRLLLDVDASKSVVKQGNSNRYLFRPVIRVFFASEMGAIKGRIAPSNVRTIITAISGTDSVSTYTNSNGSFLLQGLTNTSYKVVITPQSPYQTKEISGVAVSKNTITDLSVINL